MFDQPKPKPSPSPQRPLRARGAPPRHRRRPPLHAAGPRAPGPEPGERVALHGHVRELGPVRLQHHDHHRRRVVVQPRLLPRGLGRGLGLGQQLAHSRRVCGQLLPGEMGRRRGDEAELRHPGRRVRGRVLACCGADALGEGDEDLVWSSTFCYGLISLFSESRSFVSRWLDMLNGVLGYEASWEWVDTANMLNETRCAVCSLV